MISWNRVALASLTLATAIVACSPSSGPDIGGGYTPGRDSGTATDAGTGKESGRQDAGVGIDAAAEGGVDADEGDGAIYDFGCGSGAGCKLTEVCCATPGANVTFACVAPGSCSDANKVTCDGPDECSGATPVCCGVETTNGIGTYPQCQPAALGTSCTTAANCNTHLGTSCNDTSRVVICHTPSDCNDATNNQCCTFNVNGASITFCIDSTTATLGGAQCH